MKFCVGYDDSYTDLIWEENFKDLKVISFQRKLQLTIPSEVTGYFSQVSAEYQDQFLWAYAHLSNKDMSNKVFSFLTKKQLVFHKLVNF